MYRLAAMTVLVLMTVMLITGALVLMLVLVTIRAMAGTRKTTMTTNRYRRGPTGFILAKLGSDGPRQGSWSDRYIADSRVTSK